MKLIIMIILTVMCVPVYAQVKIQGGTIITSGVTPRLTVGTVTTGAPGSAVTFTLSGTAPNYVVNVSIPQGATGAAPVVAIGTVSTLAPGASATMSITGTAPNFLLNVGIPAGVPGGSLSYPGVLSNGNGLAVAGIVAATALSLPGMTTTSTNTLRFGPQNITGSGGVVSHDRGSAYISKPTLALGQIQAACTANSSGLPGQNKVTWIVRMGTSIEASTDTGALRSIVENICGKSNAGRIAGNVAAGGNGGWVGENSHNMFNARSLGGAGTSGPCANFNSQPLIWTGNGGNSDVQFIYDKEPTGGTNDTLVVTQGSATVWSGSINFYSAMTKYMQWYTVPLDPAQPFVATLTPSSNGCSFIDSVIADGDLRSTRPGGAVFDLAVGGRGLDDVMGQRNIIPLNEGRSSTAVTAGSSTPITVDILPSGLVTGSLLLVDHDSQSQISPPTGNLEIIKVNVSGLTITPQTPWANSHSGSYWVSGANNNGFGNSQASGTGNTGQSIQELFTKSPDNSSYPNVKPFFPSYVLDYNDTNDGSFLASTVCSNYMTGGGINCFNPNGTSFWDGWVAGKTRNFYFVQDVINTTASDSNGYIYVPQPPYNTDRGAIQCVEAGTKPSFNPAQFSSTTDGTCSYYNLGPATGTNAVTSFQVARFIEMGLAVNASVHLTIVTEPANDSCLQIGVGGTPFTFATGTDFCSTNNMGTYRAVNSLFQPPYQLGWFNTAVTPRSLMLSDLVSVVDNDWDFQSDTYNNAWHAPIGQGNPHPGDSSWGDPHIAFDQNVASKIGIGSLWDGHKQQLSESLMTEFALKSYLQPVEPIGVPPETTWCDNSNTWIVCKRKLRTKLGAITDMSAGVWQIISGPSTNLASIAGSYDSFASNPVGTIQLPMTGTGITETIGRVIPGTTYTVSAVIGANKLGNAQINGLTGVNNTLWWNPATNAWITTIPNYLTDCVAMWGGAAIGSLAGNEKACSWTVKFPDAETLDSTYNFGFNTNIAWSAGATLPLNYYITMPVSGMPHNFKVTVAGTTGVSQPGFYAGACNTTCTDGTLTWAYANDPELSSMVSFGFGVTGSTVAGLPVWAASTYMFSGTTMVVAESGFNHLVSTQFSCTTGSTLPIWGTNTTMVDGNCRWEEGGKFSAGYIRGVRIEKGASRSIDLMPELTQVTAKSALHPIPGPDPNNLVEHGIFSDAFNGGGIVKELVSSDAQFRTPLHTSNSTLLAKCVSAPCGPAAIPGQTFTCTGGDVHYGGGQLGLGVVSLVTEYPNGSNVGVASCQNNTMALTGANSAFYAGVGPITLLPQQHYVLTGKVTVQPAPWQASLAYLSGAVVKQVITVSNVPNTYWYRVTTAGTSGGIIPNFAACTSFYPTCTVTDGTAVWTNVPLAGTSTGNQGLLVALKGAGTWYLMPDLVDWNNLWTPDETGYTPITYGVPSPFMFQFTSPSAGQQLVGSLIVNIHANPQALYSFSDLAVEPGDIPTIGPGLPAPPSVPLVASLVTTAATTNTVAVVGMTATGHCNLTPTNAAAATNLATTYVSAKTTDQITVTHTATASMNYDVTCTVY